MATIPKNTDPHFMRKVEFFNWYEKLDQLFASTDEIRLGSIASSLIYPSYRTTALSSYIHNIDQQYDRDNRCMERSVFYAGIFAAIMTDDANRTVVTKKSATRAFDAFHINSRSVFNTFIYELLEDKDSVIRTFYGFMTEEESQILLETEGQWLLRMDKDGFIVTEATSINKDGTASVKNHRLIYECGHFYLNGTIALEKLAHITEIFPMEMAHHSSPYFALCYDGHPTYYGHDDSSDRAYVWENRMQDLQDGSNKSGNFRSVVWALKVGKPKDPLGYVRRCAFYACHSGTVDETIRVLQQCLKLGATLNESSGKDSKSITESVAESCELKGDFEKLRNFLWSNGFDPNARGEYGYPTLWSASSNRYWANKVSTLWTDHPDMDINISSSGGGHVLLWSPEKLPDCILNHPKVNINVCNSVGSVIDSAIEYRNVELLRKFIKRGADVKRKTSKNRTYLHSWIDHNEKETDLQKIQPSIRIFLEYGLNIDELNGDGLSALHVAAQKGTIEIVKTLVEEGANIHGHPDSETTPLHLAAERGDITLVKYLLERGADVTKRNSAGQLPKDVAALSAKELFETGTPLPPLNFTCKYRPVDTSKKQKFLPFPRYDAQCFFIGEYFYIWGGQVCFFDWFDDYGYVSLQYMVTPVGTCWRTKISNTLLVWENIPIDTTIKEHHWRNVTCANVEGKIWFHTEKGNYYAIYKPNKQVWSKTSITSSIEYFVDKYFFDFGDRLVHPTIESLGIYDKTTHRFERLSVDKGDLDIKDLFPRHVMIYMNDSFWVKNERTIYTVSLNKKRWLKSTTLADAWYFATSIVGFGNRFLLAIVRNIEKKCNLFVQDIESGLCSYHDVEFDYTGFSECTSYQYEDLEDRSLDAWRKHERQLHDNARVVVVDQIAQRNFPFSSATLAIFGATLTIFGGSYEEICQTSDLLTLDLSPLLPYLSLEQLAGIAASKNCANYSIGEMKRVATAIRSKFNLYK